MVASEPAMQYQLNNFMLDGPLTPLNNQVMVKLSKVDEKTTGGLFLGSAATEKPKEGVVIAAGPGYTHPETGKLIPNPLKEGMLVLLADFTGEKVDYNGDKHIFVDADNVLGYCETPTMQLSAFTPTLDKLLLAVQEAAKETTTGIALALDEDEDNNQGEVVAVGAGKMNSQAEALSPLIAVGENVLYAKGMGLETTIDSKKYLIVSAADCLAKW